MKKSFQFIFVAGSLLMLSGIILAGLTYREMRTQRLLHEPLRLFKIDLSRESAWQSAPLPVYQDGAHAIFLAASAPAANSAADQPQDPGLLFRGRVEVVVENDSGEVASRSATNASSPGSGKPDGLIWFGCDTLFVKGIASSNWKISMRVSEADSCYKRNLGEIIVIPPHPELFTPYLAHESNKLYGSGILLVAGFLLLVFGNRRIPGNRGST